MQTSRFVAGGSSRCIDLFVLLVLAGPCKLFLRYYILGHLESKSNVYMEGK